MSGDGFPPSFVETERRVAEHLGRLSIGRFAVYRDVVRCYIVDETGTHISDVVVPTRQLDASVLRKLWSLQVDLAPLVADTIRHDIRETLGRLIDLAAPEGEQ